MATRTAIVLTGLPDDGLAGLAAAAGQAGIASPAGDALGEALAGLADRILETYGLAWDRPGPVVVPGLSRPESARLLAESIEARFLGEAVDLLAPVFENSPSLAFELPQACFLQPLLRRALAELDCDMRVVLVLRDPLAAARALRASRATPIIKALRLWTHYAIAAMAGAGPDGILSTLLIEGEGADLAAALRRLDPAGRAETPQPQSSDRNDSRPAGAPGSSLVAPLTEDTHGLAQAWSGLTAGDRIARAAALAARLEDALVLGGQLVQVPPATFATTRPKAPSLVAGRPRPVILHYHLFKNAGTSVDAMLRQNFADRWVQQEFTDADGGAGQFTADAVAAFIADHPELEAISSHTALMPVPSVAGVDVFPIIFLRHPVDRLASAYRFERVQPADTFGARIAKENDFAGYLRILLDHPTHRAARNFQTYRLSLGTPDDTGPEIERARRTAETLPFIGLVEAFDESLEALEGRVSRLFPDFRATVYRQNVTRADTAELALRLERISDEVGEELYRDLVAANADDLRMFSLVAARFGYAAP